MKQLNTPQSLRQWADRQRLDNKTIGFVPTMGALHDGHRSLLEKAVQDNDRAVLSLFVNPTQFNKAEDLEKYPRTLEDDLRMAEDIGVAAVFLPEPEQMYPAPTLIRFSFEQLEQFMEAPNRPGHFNGVCTVVSKLFHLVGPSRAYFGQKDLQQLRIVQRMVSDLFFPIEVVPCPIVREDDGLAMSSRNKRLSPTARQEALCLSAALSIAEKAILDGEEASRVLGHATGMIESHEVILEYFELVDSATLTPTFELQEGIEYALCVAAEVGGVRLIDNVVFTL